MDITTFDMSRARTLMARAIAGMALLAGTLAPSASAAVITFDDVISAQTSYAFDGDGDSVHDVLFTTTDPGGFNTTGPGPNMNYIHEPGLEGTATLPEDLRVSFLNGAVGSLSFGFALSSPQTGPDVYTSFAVYNAQDQLLASSQVFGAFTATGSGTSSFPEGVVTVSFSGVASYATFDFSSGGRYIIDDFTGTLGSTESEQIEAAQTPEPSSLLLLISGAGMIGFARRFRS